MSRACDLQMDANGEEIFWVDKKTISTFSYRLSQICYKNSKTASSNILKIILHDLPGGPNILEQILRFCYNGGRIEINPTNVCLLNFAAHFLEMRRDVASTTNLVEQTVQFLKQISYWTWSQILVALRQCQDHLSLADSSGVFERVSESVVCRIQSTSEASPGNSSPDSSGFRVSFDTRSTLSTKICPQRAWWFDDLAGFKSDVVNKVIKRMVSAKIEHGVVCRFLLYYLKKRTVRCMPDAKRKVIAVIIDLLYTLKTECLSCKGLFWILRLSLPLHLNSCHMTKLDTMIGSQIDQATLDNILIASTNASSSLYDVNLVLRFLKCFLNNGGGTSIARLKRVGNLVDLYLAEVAPDPSLKIQMFLSLAMALPDSARDLHDGIYRAIDMYVEVHPGLSEEQKMSICCVLNYTKLSSEACRHIAQNTKLPPRTAIQALVSQQYKLKNLLQDANNYKSLQNSPCNGYNFDGQVILYANKLDLTTSENEKLKAQLEGMRWRVIELEKICRKMQSQVTKFLKGRRSSTGKAKLLPQLCK